MADEDEIKRLRDEIARLLTANIALREQIGALRAGAAETRLSDLCRSVAASIARANDTLAADAPVGAPRRTVVSVESQIRGVLAPRAGELAFCVPLPEQPVPADQLGSVHIAFGHVPRAGRPAEEAP
ncbi:MAG: hypothetical protein FJW96_14175, partial [Actinobacteria bacterium]|nr:hypothetical protein [Actinomycetota bacterium]